MTFVQSQKLPCKRQFQYMKKTKASTIVLNMCYRHTVCRLLPIVLLWCDGSLYYKPPLKNLPFAVAYFYQQPYCCWKHSYRPFCTTSASAAVIISFTSAYWNLRPFKRVFILGATNTWQGQNLEIQQVLCHRGRASSHIHKVMSTAVWFLHTLLF